MRGATHEQARAQSILQEEEKKIIRSEKELEKNGRTTYAYNHRSSISPAGYNITRRRSRPKRGRHDTAMATVIDQDRDTKIRIIPTYKCSVQHYNVRRYKVDDGHLSLSLLSAAFSVSFSRTDRTKSATNSAAPSARSAAAHTFFQTTLCVRHIFVSILLVVTSLTYTTDLSDHVYYTLSTIYIYILRSINKSNTVVQPDRLYANKPTRFYKFKTIFC